MKSFLIGSAEIVEHSSSGASVATKHGLVGNSPPRLVAQFHLLRRVCNLVVILCTPLGCRYLCTVSKQE